MKVTANVSSATISQSVYNHFVTDDIIKSLPGLSNIPAFRKSIANKQCGKKSRYIDVTINALNQYVQSTYTSNLSSDSDDEMNASDLLQFIIRHFVQKNIPVISGVKSNEVVIT